MPASTTTTTPAGELSLPDLESELLGLAGHIAAAECRFLRLLAEFDDRGGWCGVGVRSCAHWLTWRAGMSLRTATEHLRVAHALTRLPRITEAFAAGRISYSKVRAVTRLVGAEDAVLDRVTAPSPMGPATEPLRDPGSDPDADADPGVHAGSGVPDAERAEETTTPPADSGDTVTHDDTASEAAVVVVAPEPQGDAGAVALLGAAAGPDAEQVLLDLALGGTASHVETVVRAVRRRCAPPSDVAARRG
ncbi:DUF222 domain-containing protein [Pseudonocardia sp. Ae505_Ps2]|uniref:DUF222 domain-containing protein n=1 Tax=Pseudonocardia sp. Ae505_Ps2 TaxID=1885034 RepID=UPI00094ECD08|nr:DUF222 domain-containing protein [Pseudonocardia sp. Ae505_Ps2]OLM10844.1 hypothetical protein Ae505Ps2_0967 [Pseudonocardia sp. Ae505_Ps2]